MWEMHGEGAACVVPGPGGQGAGLGSCGGREPCWGHSTRLWGDGGEWWRRPGQGMLVTRSSASETGAQEVNSLMVYLRFSRVVLALHFPASPACVCCVVHIRCGHCWSARRKKLRIVLLPVVRARHALLCFSPVEGTRCLSLL